MRATGGARRRSACACPGSISLVPRGRLLPARKRARFELPTGRDLRVGNGAQVRPGAKDGEDLLVAASVERRLPDVRYWPETDRVVVPARGEPATIGREGDAVGCTRMAK